MNDEQRKLAKEVYSWATAARAGLQGSTEPKLDMEYFLVPPTGLFLSGPIPLEQMKEGGCQTSACIAGYTALATAPPGTLIAAYVLYLPDGREIPIEEWAAGQLGLTEDEVHTIFYAINEDGPELLLEVIEQ